MKDYIIKLLGGVTRKEMKEISLEVRKMEKFYQDRLSRVPREYL